MAQPTSIQPEQIQPLPTLIDNRAGNTMLEAIGRLMHEAKSLDIATGYFEVGAMVDLDAHWKTLDGIRVLMGDETSRSTRQALIKALQDRANGIENAKETDDWNALEGLAAVKKAIAENHIQARIYTKDKFHAKAYHFKTGGISNRGIVGSSNFTRPGLTRNLELNLFTSDNSQLAELGNWYERAWNEAEDIREDLLRIIEPHVREYHPFEIYLQAMRERFFSLDADETTWEKTESAVYPVLAQYQKDAYYDLKHMADRWGGAVLCDGVGLGKTFVALMLIEKARHERQKVLVIAPKAAIPSVWNRNLSKFFPDDFGRTTDDIRVIPHTDFGRHGGYTDEEVDKLRNRYDTIIVDEAHHFRVPSRNRSLKLKRLTKGKRLFMLTATPINNSVLDLYFLLNYISQDRTNHFQEVNVPHLRRWFGEREDETGRQQPTLDYLDTATFQEFLRHVLVQRSRKYVKSLDLQENEHVKFPLREIPEVIDYSLSEVYGALFPQLAEAFNPKRGKLKLVIYETEKFKEKNQRDDQTLNEQSQVIALIRTMLVKRLESSQVALEASLEDLLLKHIALMKDLQPLKLEAWRVENEDLYETLQKHRQERLGKSEDDDDEEEDDLPLTPYEAKKLGALKEEIKFFGVNETIWLDSLEADLKELGQLVRGIYEVTHPETDAKLKAFVEHIRKSPKLLNDKFVLFTEFKDTARYLEQQLKRHFPNDNIVEVDSGRNVGNRESVIKRFAPYYNCENDKDLDNALKDPIRILISTDVLSEGLNLQDANIIVNYDLHWNPVRLMQRIGRVDRRMDPSKPVDYDRVYVYNFLPPAELNQVVDIYNIINDKLIVINRAIGIEAPVLTAKDDFKAQDYYLNLGEGTMSTVERLRLKAHELSKQHPELWQKTTEYPNRIYSGKASPSISGRGGQGGEGGRYLFLCYRLVTGYEPGETIDQTTRDARWVMVNRETGEITEDLDRIHEQIECAEGTLRKVEVSPKERTRLRKVVENELIDVIRYRSQIPDDFKDELVCWMEVG